MRPPSASPVRRLIGRTGPLGWRVPFAGIALDIRPHALAFFVLLAVLLELAIMPWALDTHPMVHPHGVRPLVRISVHAPALARYLGALALTALTAVAGLVHELGHAFALRRAGATAVTITLHGAGGACRAEARDTTPLALFWYAAAGPLATMGVIVVLLALRMALPLPHAVRALLWLGAAVQVGTLLLNVLPLFRGSDGRHMLRALAALTRRDPAIVAAPVVLPALALLLTLQSDTGMVVLWLLVTGALTAAVAGVAWLADRRLPAPPPRPAIAGQVISFFQRL